MTLRIHFLTGVLLLCLSTITTLSATHIVGGDLTYSFIQFDANQTNATFEFTLNLYRDTSPTSDRMPGSVDMTVYKQLADGTWQYVTAARPSRSPIQEVPFIENPCREEPTYFVGVETAFFQARFTLPIIQENYMVVSRICCRNNTISNIVISQTGATFDVLLTPEAQKVGNNSVKFNKYPPIFVCTALTLEEDVSGIDPEGDSLTYELCTPLNSSRISTGCGAFSSSNGSNCVPPFDNVVWNPGFTDEAPMGGNPKIGIDALTGTMTGIPTANGQYVVGMCIREYRNGQLLSVVRRDFQFNSIACGEELNAIVGADQVIIDSSYTPPLEVYYINVCGPDEAVVQSRSTGGTVIYTYEWRVADTDGNLLAEAQGTQQNNIAFPLEKYGRYTGQLILNNGLDCPDTAYFHLYANPSLEADFTYDQDSCFLASMLFSDESITRGDDIVGWEWDFDGESNSQEKNPIYKFQDRGIKTVSLVAIDNNNCRDTITQVVEYEPLFDQDIPYEYEEKLICFGDSIFFIDEYITETGAFLKRLTDDSTGCDTLEIIWDVELFLEPVIVEEEIILCPEDEMDFYGQTVDRPGLYIHRTQAKTSDCDTMVEFLEVEMHPAIIPDFNLVPLYDCYPGRFAVSGTATLDEDDIVSTQWDLGDGNTFSAQNNFFHQYVDNGTYTITLVMEDVNGCIETMTQDITYDPPYDFPSEVEEDLILCPGDSTFFDNQWIGASGTYKDNLQYADNSACDSILRTLNIFVQPQPEEIAIDEIKCPEDVFTFQGNVYEDVSQDIVTEVASISGCDSVIYYINVEHYDVPVVEFPGTIVQLPEFVDIDFPVTVTDNYSSIEWTGEGLDCIDCPDPQVNYYEDGTYTIHVESLTGCENDASVYVDFIEIPHYIPNIIDLDAAAEINRCFLVQKPEYALKTEFYDLTVFDRWGNIIYDKQNLRINDTSECFTGEGHTPGVYVYHIAVYEPNQRLDFRGTLTLLP